PAGSDPSFVVHRHEAVTEMRTMRTWTMALVAVSLWVAGFGGRALAQEKRGKGLQLTDLPAGVQKTVRETLNGGDIKHITKEKEDGIEQYEIESVLNGKARDFNVDV